MSHLKPISIFLYTCSLAIIISGVTVFYLLFSPVNVLENWNLRVDNSISYAPGATVYLNSTYKKVKDVSGMSKRYLQCRKPNSNQWDGYIALTQSDANRPPTKNGHSVSALGIPLNVPNLPNICRIYVNVVYQINPLRTYVQYNYSNTFKVAPGVIVPPQNMTSQPSSNSQDDTQETSMPTTQITPPTQTDFVQPMVVPQEQEATPVAENAPPSVSSNSTFLQRLTSPVTALLNLAGL